MRMPTFYEGQLIYGRFRVMEDAGKKFFYGIDAEEPGGLFKKNGQVCKFKTIEEAEEELCAAVGGSVLACSSLEPPRMSIAPSGGAVLTNPEARKRVSYKSPSTYAKCQVEGNPEVHDVDGKPAVAGRIGKAMVLNERAARERDAADTVAQIKSTRPGAKAAGPTKIVRKGKVTQVVDAKPAAAPKPKKDRTVASVMRALIMAGGKTDDQIFAEVKAEFGLDDGKRGYVKWYRNDLIKKGEKPPAPLT